MKKKHLAVMAVIALLIIPAIFLVSITPEEEKYGKESPSSGWVERLNKARFSRTEFITEKALVIPSTGEAYPELAAAATSAAVYRMGSEQIYNPVIVKDEDLDAMERYFQLTEREEVSLETSDVTAATIELASSCWLKSDIIILYSDYRNALAAAPLASYYNIPMIFINESSKEVDKLISQLGCKYAISLGNAPAADIRTMGIGYDSEVTLNEFFLWCLESNGETCDYVVITNPSDVFNTWGEPGYIPTAGISTTAAQVAAYRHALIYFVKGLQQNELMINTDDLENYNLMGAEIVQVNGLAEAIKQQILHAKNLTERYGGELKYLGLVGDPIAVPFYYEYFGEGKFDGTYYAASDYYYADLVDDEKQDICHGRILGRSLTDTSLLCVRSLGFEEYSEISFEKGNEVSERFYDTFSENWKENAGVFVGTSKPLPMPGALKHMKKFHYDVLSSAGMFVTGEESLKLNDVTAAEMLDKMNYLMYCGHGNVLSWYSNRADFIDASFVSTQKLKPGFSAVMACQTSRTDKLDDPNDIKISLAYIHAGLNGYIGASRLAYGLFKVGDGEQGMLLDTGALYLVDRISSNVAEGGYTIGELLQMSRNELIDKYGIDDETSESEEAKITCWEYVLYGDPAWMPAY